MSSKPKPNPVKVNDEHGLVPKLRFPQFAGQPWRTIRLAQVTAECTERNGGQLTSEAVKGVTKADGIVPMRERLIGADISRYKIVRHNWFAYNPMRLNIGSIARWQSDRDVLVSPDYVVFRCLEGCEPEATPDFVDHFRRSRLWEAFVTESGDGSVRTRIYYKDIGEIALGLPTVAEQQRIANCLTALNEAINAIGRKVEVLRAHKGVLLQHLFPQMGQTIPRLRFPEFRGGPGWSTIPLGELLDRKPEYGVNASAVPFADSLPTYLRITDIDEGGRFVRQGKVSVEVEAAEDNSLQEGDIVLARTGASVGKSYRYRPEDGPLVFAGFLIRVRPDRSRLVPTFLSSFLTTRQFWDWVRTTSARSGQPGINGTEYASLPIPVPNPSSNSNLLEQQRIADCISSLDETIVAEVAAISALKAHQSGLMQALFPGPEKSS